MPAASSRVIHRLSTLRHDPKRALIGALNLARHRLQGFSYDFYENGEHELLKRLAGLPVRVVFDVGSNVGDWAKMAAQTFPNAQVHCFELSTTTCQTLSHNLEGSRFIVNNLGLSDAVGTVSYKDYGAESTVNTVLLNTTFHDQDHKAALLSAAVTTGAAYCEARAISDIDLLKIDVEGAESLVLKGFSPMLGQRRIRIVQFEYGYANGDAHFLMRDFYEFFQAHGYKVGRIQKSAVQFSPWTYRHNDFDSGPNYVAILASDNEVFQRLAHRA